MPEGNNPRVSITLSRMCYEEMAIAAEEKNIPLSQHLAQIIEAHHETPSYGNFIRRVQARRQGRTYFGGKYDGTEE